MKRTKFSRECSNSEDPTPTSRAGPNRGTCVKSDGKSDQIIFAENLAEQVTKRLRNIIRQEVRLALKQIMSKKVRSDESANEDVKPEPPGEPALLIRAQGRKNQDHWVSRLKSKKGVPELARFMIQVICKANRWKNIPRSICIRPVTDAYAAIKFLTGDMNMTVREIQKALEFWIDPKFDEQRRFIMISRPIQLKEKMPRILAAMKSIKHPANYSHVNPNLIEVLHQFTSKPKDDIRLLSIADEIQSYYRQSDLWKKIRKGSSSYDRVTQVYGTNEAMMISWYGNWLKSQGWLKSPEKIPLFFFKPTSKPFCQWNEESANEWGGGKL